MWKTKPRVDVHRCVEDDDWYTTLPRETYVNRVIPWQNLINHLRWRIGRRHFQDGHGALA